jgi:hypothetical protein
MNWQRVEDRQGLANHPGRKSGGTVSDAHQILRKV